MSSKKHAGNDSLLSADQRDAMVDQNSKSDEEEVRDRLNLIYFIAMLLGVGILNSYNFLVCDLLIFFQNILSSTFATCYVSLPVYTYTDLLFLILTVSFGEALSMTSRIVFCFILSGISLFFPFLTHFVFTDESYGFYIILGAAAITGATTATLQCTITGFCNFLPLKYIMVSVAGQSIAGIAAGVLRVAINVIQSHTAMDTELNAFIYFGIGGALNIICGLSFLYAIRSAFVRFHLREYFWARKYRGIKGTMNDRLNDNVLKRADTETILKKMVDDSLPTPKTKDFQQTPTAKPMNDTHFGYADVRKQIMSPPSPKLKRKRKRKRKEAPPNGAIEVGSDSESTSEDEDDDFEKSTVSTCYSINNSTTAGKSVQSGHRVVIPSSSPHRDSPQTKKSKKRRKKTKKKGNEQDVERDDGEVTFLGVFRKIKLLFLSIFLVFFVTFLPFPGMLVSLESEHEWIREGGWMSVFLVLIYNLGDYIGRQFLAAYTTFSFSKRTLWIGCAWRMLLYPVFVVLYEGTIQNDWIAYGATAILGITNGHFCCLCFVWAPSLVTSKEQPLMGSMMSFALVMGIVLGSNTTLLLNTLHVL